MRIRIQKFGGTSLSTTQSRAHAIDHIISALDHNVTPIVVVSAMGRAGEPYATDTLIDWVKQQGGLPPAREMDLLLGCGEIISAVTLCTLLQAKGIKAYVLTGGQAGIVTDHQHGDAKIVTVQPQKIQALLETNQVIIVAGFQGRTNEDEITTLGRGGSDTTAVALGVALGADCIDIFTDVAGILTADPNVVQEARRLQVVSYAEICNMAYNGAKVIHPRAIEMAMQANVPLRIRSTFSRDEGTLVTQVSTEEYEVKERLVTGIAHVPSLAQIQVRAEDEPYDLQLRVFKTMARHQISVDFINVNPTSVVYTVYDHEVERAVELLQQDGLTAKTMRNCAKVAVIGGGMNGVPGIMAQIIEALSSEEIPIFQSADSNTTIWILVAGAHMVEAVRTLHHKFQLHLH